MQRSDLGRPLFLFQPPPQQRTKQVVIAVPQPLLVQRHQKETAAGQVCQERFCGDRPLAGNCLTQRIT